MFKIDGMSFQALSTRCLQGKRRGFDSAKSKEYTSKYALKHEIWENGFFDMFVKPFSPSKLVQENSVELRVILLFFFLWSCLLKLASGLQKKFVLPPEVV